MLRFHTVAISADAGLRRALRRIASALASSIDLLEDERRLDPARSFHLLLFDARERRPSETLLAALPEEARVLYFVRPRRLPDELDLFDEFETAGLLCCDGELDEEDLIAAATKALRRGDIFGLKKHLPWGVTTCEMQVRSYAQKERALELLQEYAVQAGCRGPLRDRVLLCADELLMNALYHGPIDAKTGQRLHRDRTLKELAVLPEQEPVLFSYGASGRSFGLSVRDPHGSLLRDHLLDYLYRVRGELHLEDKSTGAGLGLVTVLRACSKLVFNLCPGSSTEVVALFDRLAEAGVAAPAGGPRAVHVCQVPPAPPEISTTPELFLGAPAPTALRGPRRRAALRALRTGIYLSVGLLLLGLLTLGAARLHRLDLHKLHRRLISASTQIVNR